MSGFRPEDLYGLRLPGNPTVSPRTGECVAVVETVDEERQGYRRELWVFSLTQPGRPLFVETAAASHVAPRFSPDGSALAFVSERDGARSAWCCAPDGGDIRALAALEGNIRCLEWAGPGRLVAVVEGVPERDPLSPLRISWLRYKADGTAGAFAPASEIWMFAGGDAPRRLSSRTGSVGAVASTDGHVAYSLEQLRCDEVNPVTEVRLIDLASGEDRLWWSCPSPVEGLALRGSPPCVVVAATGKADHGPAAPRLWRLGEPHAPARLFPGFDHGIEYSVAGDSRPTGKPSRVHFLLDDEIVFAATADGEVGLWAGSFGAEAPRQVTPRGRSVSDFSSPAADMVAVCLESAGSLGELHLGSPLSAGHSTPPFVRVSDLAHPSKESRRPHLPETVAARSPDALQLTGQLYHPGGDQPAPLLTRIHGGPHLCWGNAFDLEAQVAVAAGYAVLLPNLRGSSGQGSAFRAASVGQWGDGDYEDLISFVDAVASRDDIDDERLFLAGGSYGGYLTNWAITRTDRFRAAVSERSISNLLSKYGTADNGFSTNRAEMAGADLFDDGALLLLERSPLRHASAIGTPLLLLHGEDDHRCPIEQSEQLFVALRRLGREAIFVRFPGENHGLPYSGRPSNRVTRQKLILSWWEEHGGASKPVDSTR